MSLGFLRLNERQQRPNANINFIKPLATSSEQEQAIARDFLERIAAQCYPIMKRDYISVMSLEEYPPNPEFLGRNFNAGEVIQLVLKDKAGRWLSFRFVQMVMMHELAHCKQMNHSKYFWQVRNRYADHMKELWSKQYEGEGMWGRGRGLSDGGLVHGRMPENGDVPEHLCGGTYRRARRRKRKRGDDSTNSGQVKLSYAERQQKRIARKFGIHGDGQDLGEDDLVRDSLERGRRQYGKPKVAKSKRGRELRANAALARFEAAKREQNSERTVKTEYEDGSETESDENDTTSPGPLGEKIQDPNGHDVYRVCEDENEEAGEDTREMDELRLMKLEGMAAQQDPEVLTQRRLYEDEETTSEREEDGDASHDDQRSPTSFKGITTGAHQVASHTSRSSAGSVDVESARSSGTAAFMSPGAISASSTACPICSLDNDAGVPTCAACGHVLKPSVMRDHWRCTSDACKGSSYTNAGDAGRCSLCGAGKPASAVRVGQRGSTTAGTPMGVTGPELLRWD